MLEEILRKLLNGEIDVDEAKRAIKMFEYEEAGELAKVDVGRIVRTGVPEAVLAEGKDVNTIVEISKRLIEKNGKVIITRISGNKMKEVYSNFKKMKLNVLKHEKAKMVVVKKCKDVKKGGRVGILCAGTSDVAVAEEARITAEEMGCDVVCAYDVGVAGIHRLFPSLSSMLSEGVDVLIVVAGREGTLPAIVSALVDVPVIGLPVSTGYGMGGKG